MAPRGARKESLTIRWLSRFSTFATHHQERGVMACVFHTYSLSIIRTQFGQEHSGSGIEAFWRKSVDGPDDSRRSFGSSSCSQTSRPRGKKAASCIGMTRTHLSAAGAMRECIWRSSTSRQGSIGLGVGSHQKPSAGDQNDRRKGWAGHGQERHLQGTTSTDNLSDSQVAISRRV